jgi:PAS domain S-box-containing protein
MDLALQLWFRRFTVVTAALAALVGALGLLGWWTGVEALVHLWPDRPALAPVSGAMLIIGAVAVLSHGRLGVALAVTALLSGAAVLAAGLTPWPWPAPVAQPPLTAGFNVLVGGVALALRDSPRRRLACLAQLCALLVCLNALRGLLGFAPAVAQELLIDAARDVSLHGTIATLLLGLGLLTSRPSAGFMALVASPEAAGRLLRRLLVVGLGLPVLVSVVTTAAWRAGIFGAALGIVLLIAGNAVTLYMLAAAYHRADRARRAAEERLASSNADLERRVAAHTATLEEREAQLRAIGDNLPGAWLYSFTRNPEGAARFLYLSAGVERFTGLSAEAVLADPQLLYDLIDPEYRSELEAREAVASAMLTPLDAEVRKTTATGVRWSRIRSRPRRLPDGQVVWDGLEVDITPQKEAEAQIERDRRYQAALFSCSQTLLLAADTPAAREGALSTALDHLRYGADASRAFLMRNVDHPELGPGAILEHEICAPDTVAGLPELAGSHLPWSSVTPASRETLAAGQPLMGIAGSDPALEPLGTALRDRFGVQSVILLPVLVGGAPWGVIGFHDCAEPRGWDEQEVLLLRTAAGLIGAAMRRWQDEDELRRREQILVTLFDLMPVGVSLVDERRRPLQVNRAMGKIVGRDPGTIVEGSYKELRYIYPDGQPIPFEAFVSSRAIAGETVRDVEVGVIRPDGELRWASLSAAPLYLGGMAAAVVAVDITERKRVEAERLSFERTLLETQRMESLGILAGGVAHDFNNILTIILGHAELARLELPDNSDAASSLTAIALGARHAADLTAKMLAYAGKGRLIQEPVLINELAAELAELGRATLPPDVVLRYSLDPSLPPILADATQIHQVLLNFLTNAAEAIAATGASGEIVIATGRVQLSADDLAGAAISAAQPGEHCFLTVSDTGTGISPTTLARIFDPFFSTKFTGRGLGLAAVQGIVRAHHGALFVQTSPGSGSTFRACFPATAGLDAPGALAGQPADAER